MSIEKPQSKGKEDFYPRGFDEYEPEFEKRKSEKIDLWIAMIIASKIPEELQQKMREILEKQRTKKLLYGYYDIDDWVYYTADQLVGVWFPRREDPVINHEEVKTLLSEIRSDGLEFYKELTRTP